MIQEALHGFLIAEPGVSALVGDRVYPLVIPSQDFDEVSRRPCIVYSMQGHDADKTFCGTDSLRRSRFNFDCYARTYEAAQAAAAALESALIDYRGPMGSARISDVSLDTKFDLLDLEPGLFRVVLRFDIWHAE